MANVSSAFGTVSITSDELGKVFDFLKIQKKSEENSWYKTTLDEEVEVQDDTLAIKFTGTGRWTFLSNIGWFFDCLKGTELENSPFEANFVYADEEGGCQILCESDVVVSWENGKSVIKSEETTNYDYSAKNLIEFGFYNAFEAFDKDYVLDNKEYIIEHIKDFELSAEYKNYVVSGEFFDDLKKDFAPSIYFNLEEMIEALKEEK